MTGRGVKKVKGEEEVEEDRGREGGEYVVEELRES